MVKYCEEDRCLIDELSHNSDLNSLCEDENYPYTYPIYPINWALKRAEEPEKVIGKLIKMGAELNPENQEPPLIFADNNYDFNLLISLGADPNHQYESYTIDLFQGKKITPLVEFAYWGCTEKVDLLLKNGGEVKNESL